MVLFQFEHSRTSYWADFVIYGGTVVLGLPWLMVQAASAQPAPLAAWALSGFVGWSLLEYLLHRFVLHGLRPFKDWHALHHARPTSLVASLTVVTMALFLLLIWGPAAWLGGMQVATALTLGFVAGYVVYSTTQHAVHHWVAKGTWLKQQRRWHARHHHAGADGHICFGVTGRFWDRSLGSRWAAR